MKLRGLGDFVIRKVLDIDPNERYSTQPANLEQRARDALHPFDTYLEDEPTVVEWLKSLQPTIDDSVHYIHTLFPSWGWLRRYNMQWLGGDVVAGMVTVATAPTGQITDNLRHHGGVGRCSTSYGLCCPRPTHSCIWAIHVLYWSHRISGFRDVQRYRHRSKKIICP